MIRLLPLLEEQIRGIDKPRPTLIFPEGNDPRVARAASRLSAVADVVLVGDRERAAAMVESGEAEIFGSLERFLNRVRFLDPMEERELCEDFVGILADMSDGKSWQMSPDQALETVREPVTFACLAVRSGLADAVLGGVVHSSRDFFRPALRLLHTERTAFEAALFSLPDDHSSDIYQKNLVAFADVAINETPSAEDLAQIAVGSCRIVRDLVPTSVLPSINGAILSYSTRGSGEGESVSRVREAARYIPALLEKLVEENPLYKTIHIEAELQMSCAISIAAARSKLHDALADPDSPVGRANVLIVPTLDVGNILYHLYATRYTDSDRVLMVGGLNARVLDFSRSATATDLIFGGMANVLRLKRRVAWTGTPKDRLFQRSLILTINPSSVATQIAAYKGEKTLVDVTVEHDPEALAACETVWGQLAMRQEAVERRIVAEGLPLDRFDAFVGRGGLVKPVVSGTYVIDDSMLDDLRQARFGEHASNLGPAIAHGIATAQGRPSYTVDPVVVDELSDVARVTGLAPYERRAAWHALSQKAVAKRYAEELLVDYDDLNLIVAHVGEGITVGCHRRGRCVFVNEGLDEGPMTLARAGNVPHRVIFDLCVNVGLDEREARAHLTWQGGLFSHLGTVDIDEIVARVEAGDERAATVFEAFVEGIAAQVASSLVRFDGDTPDRLLLTGGLLLNHHLFERLMTLLRPLQLGITVYPGELEAEALRDGVLRVLRGLEAPRTY